jgi:hypothetical protein
MERKTKEAKIRLWISRETRRIVSVVFDRVIPIWWEFPTKRRSFKYRRQMPGGGGVEPKF